MKKLLLVVVLGAVILTSGAVLASTGLKLGKHDELISQLELSPEQQQKLIEFKQKKLRKKLGLTVEQSRQLGVIMAEAEKNRKVILEKYGLDDKKMIAIRGELRDSRKETHRQLDRLLNAEQKARLQRMRSEHHVLKNRATSAGR